MEKIHLLVLLSGLCSLSSCVSRYLQLVHDKETWSSARKYCRKNCVDLATIDDMDQMQTVLRDIEGLYNDAWIGLRKGTRLRWRWSLSQKDFYKEGEENDPILGAKDNYNCGAYKKGKFNIISCHTLLYAVCFDGVKQGREQYVVTSKKMPWTSAREHCRTHHTDLASVRNEEGNQTIGEVVGHTQVWVGLFRDPWEWSDGSDSSFRYWKAKDNVYTDLSEKKCVYLRESLAGRWGQAPCENKYKFICTCEKKFARHTIKVRISSQDSGLDLNDPAIKENLLKQIEKQMSGTNVTRIQWRTNPDGRVFVKEPEKKQRRGVNNEL